MVTENNSTTSQAGWGKTAKYPWKLGCCWKPMWPKPYNPNPLPPSAYPNPTPPTRNPYYCLRPQSLFKSTFFGFSSFLARRRNSITARSCKSVWLHSIYHVTHEQLDWDCQNFADKFMNEITFRDLNGWQLEFVQNKIWK